jgi:hypothetical protein
MYGKQVQFRSGQSQGICDKLLSLSSVLERPQTPLVKTIDNKTQMLKIMSLDLASTHKALSGNNSLTSLGQSSRQHEGRSAVSLPKINNK